MLCVCWSLQVSILYLSTHPLHTYVLPCTPLAFLTGVLFLVCRENGDKWTVIGKLESHMYTDWVYDVAWAPSIGLPVSRIASCSQDGSVIVWRKDETEGGTWTPQVIGVTSSPPKGLCSPVGCYGMWGWDGVLGCNAMEGCQPSGPVPYCKV